MSSPLHQYPGFHPLCGTTLHEGPAARTEIAIFPVLSISDHHPPETFQCRKTRQGFNILVHAKTRQILAFLYKTDFPSWTSHHCKAATSKLSASLICGPPRIAGLCTTSPELAHHIFKDHHTTTEQSVEAASTMTDPPSTSVTTSLLSLPTELLSRTIVLLNDSCPVSTACLTLTCHHFKDLVTGTLNTNLRRLVPRSCSCPDCQYKKQVAMRFLHAVWGVDLQAHQCQKTLIENELLQLLHNLHVGGSFHG